MTKSPKKNKAKDIEKRNADLRFVAYRLPGSLSDAEAFLRGQGLKDMERRMTSLRRERFFCEDDARKRFADVLGGGYAPAYSADASYEIDGRLEKKDPDGPRWRIRPRDVRAREDAVKECAERYSVSVLATNLPMRGRNSVNLRNGASADGVVDMYLGNYSFLLSSPLRADSTSGLYIFATVSPFI